MRIYKLLILMMVFFGLHSCSEYWDNGKRHPGPEPAETSEFKADLYVPGVKHIGDTIMLKAELDGVDVSTTTIFKVNGVELKRDYSPLNGNRYIARQIGQYNVVATLDDFTDSFTFEVIRE